MRKVLIVFLGAIVALSTMAVSKVNSPETGELVKNEKVVTYKLEKFKQSQNSLLNDYPI